MSIKGQTTLLAERVEIGERSESGQNDSQIAQALQRPLATVRKWRRRYQRLGRAGLSSSTGRPKTGALGQFPSQVVQAIDGMRQSHPGWGPITIRIEIQKDPRFLGKAIPSRARIAAYLKEKGRVRSYERHQKLPEPKPQKVERAHQEWELDVQGKIRVLGLGGVSIINAQDLFSHLDVGSLACLHTTHANTQDHQLILRLAFLAYGLPERVSLDHDSVFFDNQTHSPFPTVLHLWMIALGIEVVFIHRPPPAEHARIERAHQTVTQQAVAGQTFESLAELQAMLTDRIAFLNRDYPCRSLQGQAPLAAHPEAQHSLRPYRPEWEKEMLDMPRVYAYLAQGRWFRKTSSIATFSLGSQRYYASSKFTHQTLEITLDPQTCELICMPEKGSEPFRLPALGLTKEVLMGELGPLLRFPSYQLALPLSRQAWRDMQMCHQLPGTTL
jgi:hypothetical protein